MGTVPWSRLRWAASLALVRVLCGARRTAGWMAARGEELAAVLLPVECAGCGRWDVRLCGACARAWEKPPRRCETRLPRLDALDGLIGPPVWAAVDYRGSAREAVLAWKDGGRRDLARPLGAAVRRAATALGGLLACDALTCDVAPPGVVLVVPVPSSGRAVRRRGRDHTAELATAVAAGLAVALGVGHGCRGGAPAVRVVRLLRKRRGVRDQAGLGARRRGLNVGRGIGVRRGWRLTVGAGRGPVAGCVLVDDIATTGATLRACRGALARAGLETIGGVVLAVTPAPGDALAERGTGGHDDPPELPFRPSHG